MQVLLNCFSCFSSTKIQKEFVSFQIIFYVFQKKLNCVSVFFMNQG